MNTFTGEVLRIDDVVVYLKNERTGSSTIRKCKFIGQVVDFKTKNVVINRLSNPDTFVTPDECRDLGNDKVCPNDIVHIIVSKSKYHDLNQNPEDVPQIKDIGYMVKVRNIIQPFSAYWNGKRFVDEYNEPLSDVVDKWWDIEYH